MRAAALPSTASGSWQLWRLACSAYRQDRLQPNRHAHPGCSCLELLLFSAADLEWLAVSACRINCRALASSPHSCPARAASLQVMMSKCDKVLEGLQAFPQRSF